MCAREKKAKRSSYPSYRVFFYCFRPKSCKYGTGPTQERKKTGSAVNVSPVLSMTIMFTSTTMSYMTTMTNMITMTTMTGCTQGSWRLSEQMRIAASIAQIDNHQSLSHSLIQLDICRYRAALAAKKKKKKIINPRTRIHETSVLV